MRNKILHGDVRQVSKGLADKSVHCIITSPPYFGLRDYGLDAQIGLEQTPAEYVSELVGVFRELRRVLRDDGTLWLVIGDSYANDTKWGGQSGGKNYTSDLGGYQGQRKKRQTNLPPKNLLGIPWRVAFGLQDDGWILRSDIIWEKTNCMPGSQTDRPTMSHEYVFLFSKKLRYYYDHVAVREATTADYQLRGRIRPTKDTMWTDANGGDNRGGLHNQPGGSERNARTVWSIPEDRPPPSCPTSSYKWPQMTLTG